MLLALALVFMAAPAFAAGSVTVQVGDGGMRMSSGKAVYTMWVDVVTTVELVVANAKVSQPIQWPAVDGLTLNGNGFDPHRNAFTFFLTPSRVGDFTVPAFDIRADDGQTLHVGPIKFHAIPHT
jgi:hypothetical protein